MWVGFECLESGVKAEGAFVQGMGIKEVWDRSIVIDKDNPSVAEPHFL